MNVETVSFRYVAEEMARENFERQKTARATVKEGISIDDAKRRLAITFGVPMESIEIVVRV
jgi:hypothetical protein